MTASTFTPTPSAFVSPHTADVADGVDVAEVQERGTGAGIYRSPVTGAARSFLAEGGAIVAIPLVGLTLIGIKGEVWASWIAALTHGFHTDLLIGITAAVLILVGAVVAAIRRRRGATLVLEVDAAQLRGAADLLDRRGRR